MTPFQQFRLWARRAPATERVAAAIGAALALAVLGWLIVPPRSQTAANLATFGGTSGSVTSANPTTGSKVPPAFGQDSTASGSAGAVNNQAPASASGAGATAASKANTPTATIVNGITTNGPGGCVSPPGTDEGVTPTQVKIAVLLVNVAGPASTAVAGYPTPSLQQQYFQQVIDNLNSQGGVACRKLVADFYSPNVADQGSLQQTCLQVQQGGYFAVLDVGSFYLFPSLASCFPEDHIPYFGGVVLPAKEQAQYYPYLFGTSLAENAYRNAIFALQQQGFFSAADGFTKLGLVYRDCEPEYLPEVEGFLDQVGVASSKIVTYDLGCSSALYAPPSAIEQAVLKFKENGVHNVTVINDINDFANFTTVAQQQGFHPRYGLPDDGIVAASSGSGDYNYQNMDNMIVITMNRWGEQTTPGISPSAGTQACNAIFARHGEPPVYQQGDGAGGVSCDMIWELASAIHHAPAVQRNALAAGLHAAKTVEFSYPWGPNDFTGQNVTTGGEFWRPVQFHASCTCWHVLDPTFHPSFP
jgi:hypothetical protein